VTDLTEEETPDRRRVVGRYLRLEQWELPPPSGSEQFSEIAGRVPVDDHQRGPGGGLRTGALLTAVDSLGGLLAGLTVQPEWIVTTSMMSTIAQVSHRGPLGFRGRVLRRGRNAVIVAVDVFDEGLDDRTVAAVTMTSAVLDPGEGMDLKFERPIRVPMEPLDPDPLPPEEFFCIQSGGGSVTRLELAERLRNPWGILHGGAVATLADVAACRAVETERARGGRAVGGGHAVAASDTVLHYLRPVKVGPVEARCQVLGDGPGRALVKVAIHDLGADDRMTTMGTVAVVDV
jgi:uncharacterized protein (TIGR00369 family)